MIENKQEKLAKLGNKEFMKLQREFGKIQEQVEGFFERWEERVNNFFLHQAQGSSRAAIDAVGKGMSLDLLNEENYLNRIMAQNDLSPQARQKLPETTQKMIKRVQSFQEIVLPKYSSDCDVSEMIERLEIFLKKAEEVSTLEDIPVRKIAKGKLSKKTPIKNDQMLPFGISLPYQRIR